MMLTAFSASPRLISSLLARASIRSALVISRRPRRPPFVSNGSGIKSGGPLIVAGPPEHIAEFSRPASGEIRWIVRHHRFVVLVHHRLFLVAVLRRRIEHRRTSAGRFEKCF